MTLSPQPGFQEWKYEKRKDPDSGRILCFAVAVSGGSAPALHAIDFGFLRRKFVWVTLDEFYAIHIKTQSLTV